MKNKYSRRKVMLGTVASAAATLLVSSKVYVKSKGKKKLGIALSGLATTAATS